MAEDYEIRRSQFFEMAAQMAEGNRVPTTDIQTVTEGESRQLLDAAVAPAGLLAALLSRNTKQAAPDLLQDMATLWKPSAHVLQLIPDAQRPSPRKPRPCSAATVRAPRDVNTAMSENNHTDDQPRPQEHREPLCGDAPIRRR